MLLHFLQFHKAHNIPEEERDIFLDFECCCIFFSSTKLTTDNNKKLRMMSTPLDQVVVYLEGCWCCESAYVEEAATKAMEKHGFFALAIPVGSILSVGSGGADDDDWIGTLKTTIIIKMGDGDLATHAKAMNESLYE